MECFQVSLSPSATWGLRESRLLGRPALAPAGRWGIPVAVPSGTRRVCHLEAGTNAFEMGTDVYPVACDARWMTRLLSLYKARGIPVKSPLCAICLDRTRGKTFPRELAYGVKIWLCDGHHSIEFMRSNTGRDFATTLLRIWQAQGCLTRARGKALEWHLRAVRTLGRQVRARPGSYAWPRLRREAEDAFARGEAVLAVIHRLRERHAGDQATAPSIRTMRRWFAQARWLRFPAPRGDRTA